MANSEVAESYLEHAEQMFLSNRENEVYHVNCKLFDAYLNCIPYEYTIREHSTEIRVYLALFLAAEAGEI